MPSPRESLSFVLDDNLALVALPLATFGIAYIAFRAAEAARTANRRIVVVKTALRQDRLNQTARSGKAA